LGEEGGSKKERGVSGHHDWEKGWGLEKEVTQWSSGRKGALRRERGGRV